MKLKLFGLVLQSENNTCEVKWNMEGVRRCASVYKSEWLFVSSWHDNEVATCAGCHPAFALHSQFEARVEEDVGLENGRFQKPDLL